MVDLTVTTDGIVDDEEEDEEEAELVTVRVTVWRAVAMAV